MLKLKITEKELNDAVLDGYYEKMLDIHTRLQVSISNNGIVENGCIYTTGFNGEMWDIGIYPEDIEIIIKNKSTKE